MSESTQVLYELCQKSRRNQEMPTAGSRSSPEHSAEPVPKLGSESAGSGEKDGEEYIAEKSGEVSERRCPRLADLMRGSYPIENLAYFEGSGPLGPVARPSSLRFTCPARPVQWTFAMPDSQRQNEPRIPQSTISRQWIAMWTQQTQTGTPPQQTEIQTRQSNILAEGEQASGHRSSDPVRCDDLRGHPAHPESLQRSQDELADRFVPPATREARRAGMAQYRDMQQEHESHTCSKLPCHDKACMSDLPGGKGCRYSDSFHSRLLNTQPLDFDSTRPCVWGWGKILEEYRREYGLEAALTTELKKIASWYRQRHLYDERFAGPVVVRDPPNAAEGSNYVWVVEPRQQNRRERRSTL